MQVLFPKRPAEKYCRRLSNTHTRMALQNEVNLLHKIFYKCSLFAVPHMVRNGRIIMALVNLFHTYLLKAKSYHSVHSRGFLSVYLY